MSSGHDNEEYGDEPDGSSDPSEIEIYADEDDDEESPKSPVGDIDEEEKVSEEEEEKDND